MEFYKADRYDRNVLSRFPPSNKAKETTELVIEEMLEAGFRFATSSICLFLMADASRRFQVPVCAKYIASYQRAEPD